MITGNHRKFFLLADKRRIQQIVAEQNQKMGFAPDPDVTAEQAQDAVEECLRLNGLRPEDNLFSCGIIAAREE